MTSKKRKLSSFGGAELRSAYDSLLKLRKSLAYDDFVEADSNETLPRIFEQRIDEMLSLLGSRMSTEGHQSLSFPGMTDEKLDKMNIRSNGFIDLKPGAVDRIAETASLGQGKLWCSENLYRQLNVLENIIPRMTEVSARPWIDAFFFRVSAMLPPNQAMIFNMEHVVPAVTIRPSSFATLSGSIGYTAVVAPKDNAPLFLEYPLLRTFKKLAPQPSSFFVIEAKLINPWQHVPQAISEMYERGRLLQRNVVRGTLTNGRDWIFLLVKLNDDYSGASYQITRTISLQLTQDLGREAGGLGQRVVSAPWPDLIAGILLHWTQNSFEEFGDDDWFQTVPN